MRDRAYIEALLEGAPLPATPRDLAEYARRQGEHEVARRLKSLSAERYDFLDDVGEALAPVQPKWPREKRVPKPESGLPPGGPAYGIDPPEAA